MRVMHKFIALLHERRQLQVEDKLEQFCKIKMKIYPILRVMDIWSCPYYYVSDICPTFRVLPNLLSTSSILMVAQRILFSVLFVLLPCTVIAQDISKTPCSFSCPSTDKRSQPLVKRPHTIGFESFYSIFECMCVNN